MIRKVLIERIMNEKISGEKLDALIQKLDVLKDEKYSLYSDLESCIIDCERIFNIIKENNLKKDDVWYDIIDKLKLKISSIITQLEEYI